MARHMIVHTRTAAYTLSRMMLKTEGIRKGGRGQQQRTAERVEGADRGLVEEEVVGVRLVDWEGRLSA
jgi:hypothetical protein